MRSARKALSASLSLALLLAVVGIRRADAGLPSCGWPVETTGEGVSNVAYPDTDATYWTMPFDSQAWQEMRISGQFPAARFMSFTVYDAQGSTPTALFDYQIAPDSNSHNPFQQSAGSGPDEDFTVTIFGPSGTPGTNTLLLPTPIGQVIWRVYVPDMGDDRAGGVPLPIITLIGQAGDEHGLTPCDPVSPAARAARNR